MLSFAEFQSGYLICVANEPNQVAGAEYQVGLRVDVLALALHGHHNGVIAGTQRAAARSGSHQRRTVGDTLVSLTSESDSPSGKGISTSGSMLCSCSSVPITPITSPG